MDLTELIDGVLEMVRPQVEKKEQALDLYVDGKCAPILGDRDNLQGVFSNIISNAVKYTPDKGKIEVRISPEGSFVKVSVADSGVGIPKEDLSRVFEKFYRVKGKTRGITGSGLGLSVAKSIVEAHKGEIHVQSREQKGSEFIVTLPFQV